MGEGSDDGLLVLKQTGSTQAYYLNGKMVRKGARLQVLDNQGNWVSGRFEGQPLSNNPPTLLCQLPSPADPNTTIMSIINLDSNSTLRWAE